MEQAVRFESQGLQSLGVAQQKTLAAKSELQKGDVGKAKKLESDAKQALDLAQQSLKRLELYSTSVAKKDEHGCRVKVDSLSKRTADAEAKLAQLSNEIQKRDLFGAARSTTTEGNQSSSFGAFSEAEDRELLSQTMASLERSNQYLQDSQLVLSQTEEVGVNVLSNLDEQRQGILNATNKVHQTNSTVAQAQKALTRMARRACYNKLVLWIIILLLVAAIGLASYLKFIRR